MKTDVEDFAARLVAKRETKRAGKKWKQLSRSERQAQKKAFQDKVTDEDRERAAKMLARKNAKQ